jgi:hypothetical protein
MMKPPFSTEYTLILSGVLSSPLSAPFFDPSWEDVVPLLLVFWQLGESPRNTRMVKIRIIFMDLPFVVTQIQQEMGTQSSHHLLLLGFSIRELNTRSP